ncbi:hypothetical protein BAUCODRAFT_31228 [Baudoinia panamericana UAMH 10762]|uniref:Nucleolar complex-associated protein 3 n=1 Tax=Baudoinia panamericana (strain UAMH 10762) TaxID=717646 RepID=M2LWB5_BAUPA|nr:uncharacterized protein BAUCODRAFT_31228 [Baudoinia panamericana UAMH 10762]EMC98952.1 hypothetical protein BAUCODRAFT_31228 [Baudoinia panamericana UAMH 10762]
MAVEPASKRRRLSPSKEGNGPVPGFAKWDLEQEYQQRRQKKEKSKNDKLLVRTEKGWEEHERLNESHARNASPQDDEDSMLASGDDEDSGVADLQHPAISEKPALPLKEQIRLAKEDLARIAGHISESPEENIAQLRQLAQIGESENVTITKLAMGTQLAVFKDIVPGYRIRPLSKDDLQAKVSKDVKQLRTFEQTLLAGYKDYVHVLSKLCGNQHLSGVAINCVATLLTSLPHFNCRNDLIAVIVQKLGSRTLAPEAPRCLSALEQLFQEDEEGHASLEVVSQLTKMMKGKDYHIHESVLNVFLHLRLLSEFIHKASTTGVDKDEEPSQMPKKLSKKDREFRTKRERKLVKERKQVEKEMKEADAVVSYEERDKNQAETLKLVFVAYFRILKARVQHLMGAVLEGLAKYSHLINQDLFGDILEVLRDLITEARISLEAGEEDDNEELANTATRRNIQRETLLCIITAFALLQGQLDVAKSASSLHLDLNFFITQLYRTILPIGLDPDIELSAKTAHLQDPNGLATPLAQGAKVNVATTTVLLLRSLQSVLLPPTATKSVPPVRLAAHTKQLMTAALHLPAKSAAAILALLQQITKVHCGKVASLWCTEERRGDGVFDALSEEVESSNPFAATIWEGEVLKMHFDPKVREMVGKMEANIKEARK